MALAVGSSGLAGPLSALARERAAGEAEGRRERLLRAWDDTVKVNGEDVRRRVEVMFDYEAGVAHERVYDIEGRFLSSRAIVKEQPRPSTEEIAEAFGIVEAHPELGRLVSRAKAEPVGGFVLEEAKDRACGPRTRCLQLSLVSPTRGTLRWVVVDLTRQAVVYSNFGSVERERLIGRFRGTRQ